MLSIVLLVRGAAASLRHWPGSLCTQPQSAQLRHLTPNRELADATQTMQACLQSI